MNIPIAGVPWWVALLALFGRRNALDQIASLLGVTRRRGVLLWESNAKLRARLLAVLVDLREASQS